MSKLSGLILPALLIAGIAYLVYDPSALDSAWDWTRRQFGIDRTDFKKMGTPGYMPVTPKGL